MPQNLNKKICLIVECLSMGGAEKSAGLLSIALVEAGYQVAILAVKDDVVYDYDGKLYTLAVQAPNKIVKQFKKLKQFKKKVKIIEADYYVDFRFRGRRFMELMLHLFVFPKTKMVFTHHSALKKLNRPSGFIFNHFYNKAVSNIAVSKTILQQLPKHNKRLIYNFVDIAYLEHKAIENIDTVVSDYVIAVARLTPSKQLDRLIATYAASQLPQLSIKLVILGEGEQKVALQQLVVKLNMQDDVCIKGFVPNPYPYIKKAKFMLQSSLFEGFPMVLIESLALQTPVIAFDCESGPSEIVDDYQNGRLIPPQDFEALKEAMNEMVLDTEKTVFYTKNSKTSVSSFSKNNIMQQWVKIFENEN